MRTFTFSDVKSHKFWNIELQGDSFTVTYGRQGTAGQTQTKKFASAAAAQKEHDKLIKEKLAKGYIETTPTAKPKASLREALEDALVANPDDLAAHMAYADYLQEQGDPRGEYIQVQLALEDPSRSPAERKELQKREAKLFKQHGREWLGDLAPYLLDQMGAKKRDWGNPTYQFQFRRGWLGSLELRNYGVTFTRVLARAPQIRLLQRLILNEDTFETADEYEPGDDIPDEDVSHPSLHALLRSPFLGNVCIFQFGEQVDDDGRFFNCHMWGETLIHFVKLMPRLEELYVLSQGVDTDQLFSLKTLNKLRILQVYHMDDYPLQQLAKNPSLSNLTHLLIHPHCIREGEAYLCLPQVRAVLRSTTLKSLTHLRLRLCDMGDEGAEEIVASGILKRLKLLDLRNGRITDGGARLLADCPDLRTLELLNLNRNCLTGDGIAALKATGVPFTADGQWQPTGDQYRDEGYLYEGDGE
ncbi:MAG TPA: WGR domain-containing protein [Gemmataceae bacterium]|jgi:uncharacterized protein (TIGR02996 family)